VLLATAVGICCRPRSTLSSTMATKTHCANSDEPGGGASTAPVARAKMIKMITVAAEHIPLMPARPIAQAITAPVARASTVPVARARMPNMIAVAAARILLVHVPRAMRILVPLPIPSLLLRTALPCPYHPDHPEACPRILTRVRVSREPSAVIGAAMFLQSVARRRL
jgi:hypothetical protein